MKTYYRVFGRLDHNVMSALNAHGMFYFDEYDFARNAATDGYIKFNDSPIRLNKYIEQRIIKVVGQGVPTEEKEQDFLETNFKTCYDTMRKRYSLAEIMNMITEMEMSKHGD